MAQNPGRIHQNAARIFAGVTPPVTGIPPTFLAHTNGVPATGVEMGLTEGPAIFRYRNTKKMIKAEQSLAGVDAAVIDEMAEIEITVMEHTYAVLQRAFDASGTVTDGTKDAFFFGGGAGVLDARKECVVLTSSQRNAPTKYLVMVLYRCYTELGYEVGLTAQKESVYKMKFIGLADVARNAGDSVGQMFIEK